MILEIDEDEEAYSDDGEKCEVEPEQDHLLSEDD